MKQIASKKMVLITIILMDILTGMEFDLFVPSFPELQNHFSLSSFWTEALLSINFIGFCFSLFFIGGIADRYSRKSMITLGIVIFIIGTLLCFWALSYPYLLIGRFLQGVGIAAPATLSFLIVADSYSLKKQQSLLGILNGVMNVATGAAPVLGSYISLHYHWQGNFMALLFLGVVAWVMTIFFIPSLKLSEYKKSPILDGYSSIFQSKYLLLLIIFFIFNFVPYWIFVGMSPLLYMQGLGVSLSHFGYYQGALALIFALGSLFFSFIVARYNTKTMLRISMLCYVFGLLSLGSVTFHNNTNPLLITIAFLPFIIGQIIPTIILYPFCLSIMPEAKGRISALLIGGRLIFSSLCLQIAGYYYVGTFQNIGIIIIIFISMAIVFLFFLMKNSELMELSSK